MPNFSSLAGLEVAEKFVRGVGVGWFAQSFYGQTQPLCCVEVGVLTISWYSILLSYFGKIILLVTVTMDHR